MSQSYGKKRITQVTHLEILDPGMSNLLFGHISIHRRFSQSVL